MIQYDTKVFAINTIHLLVSYVLITCVVFYRKICFTFQTTDFNWIFAEVGVAAMGVGYMTQTTVSSLGLL